ncbi:DUF917 domain-containing protein [Brevibacillus fluminis]|uniref:DUF917 domain-containing protein n=1 Tax=Brevibacillus fluminis TaxID=511487 RepID=UPI003F8C609D
MMKHKLKEKDVDALACGAMFLGSGGAGDTSLLQIMAKQAIRENGPVPLLSPFDLPDDAWIVCSGLMGSPAIHFEKMMSGDELVVAMRVLERERHIQAMAIAGLEIGGINAMAPVVTAAKMSLPLIDCDGMGRAFPQYQMTTYHAFGASTVPLVICSNEDEWRYFSGSSNNEIEKAARYVLPEMGGSVAAACVPMTAAMMQEAALHHTFTVAKRLGESVIAAGADVHRVVANLSGVLQNSIYGKPHKLTEGKIVELQRYLQDDFMRGELVIEGTGFHHSEQIEVQFQSEYLLAKEGKRAVAMVPDLICVLDADSGRPLLIEELELHMKVWLIAIPAPVLLRHPKMLDVVGPWNFGVSDTYMPVEQLVAEAGDWR